MRRNNFRLCGKRGNISHMFIDALDSIQFNTSLDKAVTDPLRDTRQGAVLIHPGSNSGHKLIKKEKKNECVTL